MESLLCLPEFRNCRRLFLRGFEVSAKIGVHDLEKNVEQLVVFNVDLYVPLSESTSSSDSLDDVVDYDFIREAIMARLTKGHIHLQETLCDDVLASLLSHPKVVAACVSSEKPNVYGDCSSIGCEVLGFNQGRLSASAAG